MRIGGHLATGPALVMSHSTERFVLRRSLPVWGGPLSWPVEVDTRTSDGSGPSRTATARTFVAPLVLVLALALIALGARALWQLHSRRDRRVDELALQVAQLEQRLRSTGEQGRGDRPRPEGEAPREAGDDAAAEVDQRARTPR